MKVGGRRRPTNNFLYIIFVTVNGTGPLREVGDQLKFVKNHTFVLKLEISKGSVTKDYHPPVNGFCLSRSLNPPVWNRAPFRQRSLADRVTLNNRNDKRTKENGASPWRMAYTDSTRVNPLPSRGLVVMDKLFSSGQSRLGPQTHTLAVLYRYEESSIFMILNSHL